MRPCKGSRRNRPGHVLVTDGRCWPCERDHRQDTAPRLRYSAAGEADEASGRTYDANNPDPVVRHSLAVTWHDAGVPTAEIARRLGVSTAKAYRMAQGLAQPPQVVRRRVIRGKPA